MLARRLLLLAAVLLLLAALAAGIAPQRSEDDGTPLQKSELPGGGEVVKQLSAEPGAEGSVMVRRGDVLKLEVSGDELDSVLIERLDRIEAIEPTTPARFELLIDAPAGIYPIRLLEADRRIGTIQITN
jgi:hypothetical protein